MEKSIHNRWKNPPKIDEKTIPNWWKNQSQIDGKIHPKLEKNQSTINGKIYQKLIKLYQKSTKHLPKINKNLILEDFGGKHRWKRQSKMLGKSTQTIDGEIHSKPIETFTKPN